MNELIELAPFHTPCCTQQSGPRLYPFSTHAFARRHNWAHNALVRMIFRMPDRLVRLTRRNLPLPHVRLTGRLVRDLKIEVVLFKTMVCRRYPIPVTRNIHYEVTTCEQTSKEIMCDMDSKRMKLAEFVWISLTSLLRSSNSIRTTRHDSWDMLP